MTRLLSIPGFVLVALLTCGCGGDSTTLEAFQQQWQAAVDSNDYRTLFDLLDAESQGKIRRDLEVMRGLDDQTQDIIVQQLNDEKLQTLSDLPPDRYFALLWQRATDGEPCTSQIEESGPDTGYMAVMKAGQRKLQVSLVREAGEWRWQLPRQTLENGITRTPTDTSPPSASETTPAPPN